MSAFVRGVGNPVRLVSRVCGKGAPGLRRSQTDARRKTPSNFLLISCSRTRFYVFAREVDRMECSHLCVIMFAYTGPRTR